MWKPWEGWTRSLEERATTNAREAATELSRRRVEREEVELFVAALTRQRREEEAPVAYAVRR